MNRNEAEDGYLHKPIYDEKCPICTCKLRNIFEKYYIARRPIVELVHAFGFDEEQISLHAGATKIKKKRSNNTAAIVDCILEQGIDKLESGQFDMTLKDLAWAVGHRDKLLGRIKDKVEVDIAPVVHIHTTIPGVGGIGDGEVKELKAAEIKEDASVTIGNFEEIEEVKDEVKKESSNG